MGARFLARDRTRSIALDSAKDAHMLMKNATSPSTVSTIAGFADRAVSTSLKPDARKLYKRNILDGLGWRSLRFRERRSQRCATSLDSARLNRVTNKNSHRSKGSLDVAINPQSRREESAGRYSRRRGHIGSAGSVICLQCSDALQCTSQKRNTLDENDHG